VRISVEPARNDLSRWPFLGALITWRHTRLLVQALFLAVAVLVLYDGFFGPQLAPKNVAGVLPWVHWRGLVILALLVVGNFFCFACPFMLVRNGAKRLFQAQRAWPQALRSKWPAVALLVSFFWAYESFDLWASPLLTAALALTYFVAAFAVDGLFKGAAFCKYLCPIGHFHYVNSLVSPVEVRVRVPEVCRACKEKGCIKGRPAASGAQSSRAQPGCESWLFQQAKIGNMDCTFCLNCLQACQHDNVGVFARVPTSELWRDRLRSGVGQFSRRPDLAALVLVLVFGAFVNAFGMVAPVYSVQRWLAETLGTRSEPLILLIVFGFGLVVLPVALVGGSAWLSRALSGGVASLLSVAGRYSVALIPVGFGMWLAHYSFHFLIGALTIVPVVQTFAADVGLPLLGEAQWGLGPIVPASWLLPLEIVALELGLIGSLVVAYKLASDEFGESARRRAAFVPWAALSLLLFASGVWLMMQPMEMRAGLGG
jgi:polyferredoxin